MDESITTLPTPLSGEFDLGEILGRRRAVIGIELRKCPRIFGVRHFAQELGDGFPSPLARHLDHAAAKVGKTASLGDSEPY